MAKANLTTLLHQEGSDGRLCELIKGYLKQLGLSDSDLFAITWLIISELRPQKLAWHINLENIDSESDSDSDEELGYDEILGHMIRYSRCCKLFLAGKREWIFDAFLGSDMAQACSCLLTDLVALRRLDSGHRFDCTSYGAYRLFDNDWDTVEEIARRFDDLIAARSAK